MKTLQAKEALLTSWYKSTQKSNEWWTEHRVLLEDGSYRPFHRDHRTKKAALAYRFTPEEWAYYMDEERGVYGWKYSYTIKLG